MSGPIQDARRAAPRHWPWVPIKRVADINTRVLAEDTDPDYTFRYIDITAVRGDGSLGDLAELRFADAPSRARRVVQPSDVIVSTVRTYLRAIARVPSVDEDLIASTGFGVLSARPEVDPRFLYWWARSTPFIEEVVARSVGVGYPAVAPEELGRIATPIPPRPEQEAIADLLDRETARIDVIIRQKTVLLYRLQERRQSVIFHGVTGTLGGRAEVHDPGLAWARAVRRPWPVVKIKHVARLGTGHTPSRLRPELWENCTIPWITTGEIQHVRDDRVEVFTETRERISELGLANSAAVLHPAGTVVLCRTASAGYSAIMGTDMATSQDFATWTCSPLLIPRYLLMCLRGMRRDLLGRLAFGSTHKTIYMPDIEDLKIPLPTIGGQHEVLAEIDSRIAKIDALSDCLESQLALLAEHRQALITAAVAGEVDVPGPSRSARGREGETQVRRVGRVVRNAAPHGR